MTVEEVKIREDLDAREEDPSSDGSRSRMPRLKSLLRALALFSPIALFGLAILVGLGFWVTLIPVLGTIAAVLTIIATVLSLVAALVLFKS